MKKLLLLSAFALFALPSYGQLGNVVLKHFAGAPTGACSSNQQAQNDSNGDFYNCVANAWHKVSGATASSIAFNQVTAGTNTNALLVGTGGTFGPTGTGSIKATQWNTARNLAGNSVDGTANVAFTNKFIVQGTTDAGLSGAQFLGALTTGPLKVTTTTGVLSTAVFGDIVALWASGSCSGYLKNDGTCGAGGGISGLTTNTIPVATSSTTIGDSSLTDSGGTLTYSQNGGIKTAAGAPFSSADTGTPALTPSANKWTVTGELVTAASSTTRSGFNLPHGSAPTSPVNGDLWTTTAGLYARINGGTVGPLGTGGGGGITNSAPNLHLMESDGTNAIDSGIVRSTNDYTFPGSVVAGGSNGGIDFPEGTGAGLTAATGHDILYGDSTAHRLKVSNNNGTATTLAQFTDNLSVFAATTSAQLAGVLSDETGSGLAVFATSPTLTTPTLGVATATSINKMAITAPATSSTLAVADGKTATISNTLTFTGTDSSSVAFGGGGTVLYNGGALGTPSSGTLTNATGLPAASVVAGALSNGMTATAQAAWSNDTKVATDSYIDSQNVIVSTSMTAGHAYYISGASAISEAGGAISATTPAVCVAQSATVCVVRGFVTGLSLTAGAVYYVPTTAAVVSTPAPSSTGNLVQRVGVAYSSSILLVNPSLDVGTVQ